MTAICNYPCCCCSLKTGALIIAILEIIVGILFVGESLRFLLPQLIAYLTIVSTDIEEQDKLLAPVRTENSFSVIKNEEGRLTVLYITALIINVFVIVFGFQLLQAIRKESTSLMAAWIIFRIVAVIISIGLVTGGYLIKSSEIELLQGFLRVAINCWIISVIYYFRKAVLLDRDDNTHPVMYV